MLPGGFFRELICPDSRCRRIYCSFWHDPEPVPGPSLVNAAPSYQPANYQLAQYNYAVPLQQSYDPYNPYAHEMPTFSGYSATVAAPIMPTYEQGPSSVYNGYVATTTETNISITPGYIPSPVAPCISPSIDQNIALKMKQEPFDDDCVIIEPDPKVKIESDNESNTLTEPQDILKKATKKKLPLPTIPSRKDLTEPDKAGNILECAKSISEIDAEIERLKQLREQHKQKAAELRAPVKMKKPHEERKKDEKHVLEYSPKVKSEKSIHAYTPTPLAELERKKMEKRKAEDTNREMEQQRAKNRAKRLSSSEINQEDLFGKNPTPLKKQRYDISYQAKLIEPRCNSSTDSTKDSPVGVMKGVQLTDSQIEAAKQRIARVGATATTRPITTNRRVASAVEQMKARMDAAAKEREATSVIKIAVKKPMTLEERFGEARNKDGRTARVNAPVARSGAKPALQDPSNTKIPMTVRLQYLNKLYSEYLNFLPLNEARVQAELEEKSVLDKVKHKQGYAVACANAMRRIREIGDGKTTINASNKISHTQILLGKHWQNITVNASGPKQKVQVTEEKLYQVLSENYLLTQEQLKQNSYPVWASSVKVSIEPSYYDKKRCKKTFVDDFEMTRTCVRCNREFMLNPKGNLIRDACTYHLKGKTRQPGKIRNNDARYPCCGSDDTIAGCQVAIAHVFDTLRESELLKFQETPKATSPDDPRSEKIYALDCEMIYTVWGPALARVTVVDFNENVVLDEIVKPPFTVIDFNTTFSGITAEQIEGATHTLETVVAKFFELANSETILVGHSLESDLKALRVVHKRVVDTALLFPHRIDEQKKRGLRELCLDKLGKSIQDDIDGHDSKEDSIAALQLVVYKAKFDGKLK